MQQKDEWLKSRICVKNITLGCHQKQGQGKYIQGHLRLFHIDELEELLRYRLLTIERRMGGITY